MNALEKELAALPLLAPQQLYERWQQLSKGEAPNVPVPLLRRLVAQKLQEKRSGGLPTMVARELERCAGAVPSSLARKATSPSLTPGTRLIREWNGQTVSVEVKEVGFVWEDQTYRSLSEIARKVTGAHWSGPRFFGIARNG